MTRGAGVVSGSGFPRRFGISNLSTRKVGWRVFSVAQERLTPLVSPEQGARPIIVVGSGSEFLSGISHYTHHLAIALAETRPVGVILMRKLIPAFLYPGRKRVGDQGLSSITYPPHIPLFDGVDWNGGRSARDAIKFIQQEHPRVVIFQWWTAAVSFNYVRLARAAIRAGARVVIELHETQDVGEAKLPFAGTVSKLALNHLLSISSGVVTHSSYDAESLLKMWRNPEKIEVAVIPHGPFTELAMTSKSTCKVRPPGSPARLLYFGVIRSYKGIDDLAAAYHELIRRGANVKLTVVGEPWGKEADHALLALRQGPGAANVTVIDRFIADAEIPGLLQEADLLVLPYHRSSASGPLALAMAAGLPVVTTSVPALVEATAGYTGAVHVPVKSPEGLVEGIMTALALVGTVHESRITWSAIGARYAALFLEIERTTSVTGRDRPGRPIGRAMLRTWQWAAGFGDRVRLLFRLGQQ